MKNKLSGTTSQPSQTASAGDNAVDSNSGSNVSTIGLPATGTDFLAGIKARQARNGETSVALLQTARQLLAEARDMEREGGDKAEEAEALAGKAAKALIEVRISGAATAEQVNAALGDLYGFKAKGGKVGDPPVMGANNPKASKTPHGTGEAIRKRIVRAVQTHEFVEGKDTSSFFEGMDVSDIAPKWNAFQSGDVTVWQLYKALQDFKTSLRDDPTPAAYDARKVAAMNETISANVETIANLFIGNPDLALEYAALRDAINLVSERAGEIVAERSVAA